MSWFFEIRERRSAKNGIIRARRDMGSWNVSVENCGQTSSYLNEMWNKAFKNLALYRGDQPIKSVLMLGLGAGGEIAKIYRTFKGSNLTVVEYDEEMIALTKELKLYRPAPLPHIICDDAAVAVPKLQGTFDLIIVDLFKGAVASPLSRDEAFLKALEAKLFPSGFMLVKVYKQQELFSQIANKFLFLKQWKFEFNNLALFTTRAVPEAISNGYLPMQEWPDNDPVATMSDMHGSYVDEKNKQGLYWRFGPLSFEKYFGDTEPEVAPLPKDKGRPFRIIMWQRLLRGGSIRGWASFGRALSHKIGFVDLATDYQAAWSETAKRYSRKWEKGFKDSLYTIEETTYEEFASAYIKSTIPLTLRQPTLWGIRMLMKNRRIPTTFIVARRKRDGRVVSGMACAHSSVLPVSYYMAGFILKEVGNDPVMTGVFEYWFAWCKKNNLRFADFGGFWWKGGDQSWKGLSLFKSKFGPLYLFYPPVLYQFKIGKRR